MPQDIDNPVDLLGVATSVSRHRRLFWRVVISCLLLGLLLAVLLPKQYTAETRIMTPQQGQSIAATILGSQLGALSALTGAGSGFKTPTDLYVSLLQSRTVEDAVVKRFNLMEVYNDSTLTRAREDLDSATKVLGGKEGIITLTVDDRDPDRAAQVANGFIDELYKLNKQLAITEAGQRREFFERELAAAKDDLTNAERQLKKVQESTGLIEMDAQAKSIIQAVTTARAKVAAKEVELSTLRSYATPNNPDVLRAERELSALQSQANKLEKKQGPQSAGDIAVPTSDVPTAGLEYARSLREVRYREAVFENLAKQYEIAKIDEAKNASAIQVVDPAVRPEKKTRPKRLFIMVAALFAGLLVGLGSVLMLDWWHRFSAREVNQRRLNGLRSLWSAGKRAGDTSPVA